MAHSVLVVDDPPEVVEMARMDGLEALPILRKACPRGVIIIYSSDPMAPGRVPSSVRTRSSTRPTTPST